MNEYLRNGLLIASIVLAFGLALFFIGVLIWLASITPWGLIPIWMALGALAIGGAFALAQLCVDHMD